MIVALCVIIFLKAASLWGVHVVPVAFTIFQSYISLKENLQLSPSCDTVCIVGENQVSNFQYQHYKLLDAWKTCLLQKEIEEKTRPTCDCDTGFLFVKLSKFVRNQNDRNDNTGNSTSTGKYLHEEEYGRICPSSSVNERSYNSLCPAGFVYCPEIEYCVEETPDFITLCPDSVKDRYWVIPTSGNEEFQLNQFWSEKDVKHITILGIDYRQGQWEYQPSESFKWKNLTVGARVNVMDYIRFTAHEDVPVISRILALDSNQVVRTIVKLSTTSLLLPHLHLNIPILEVEPGETFKLEVNQLVHIIDSSETPVRYKPSFIEKILMSHAGKWLDRFVIQEQFLSIPTQLVLIPEIPIKQRKGLRIEKLGNDPLSFEEPCQISLKDQIWIETNPDYFGNFSLSFLLKIKDMWNRDVVVNINRLTLTTNKKNSAPYHDIKGFTNRLFSTSALREGIPVFNIVASFYTDFNNEKLGMAVLLNNQENVGNWEIKASNSEWQSLIVSEQEERLEFDIEQIYEPVNICQYLFMEQQEYAVLRLVPSNFSIRIKQTNNTFPLFLEQATKLPRLMFTAWDMEEAWSGNMLRLEPSTCEQTFSATRSLSPVLSFLYGVEYDCSNGPVIHQALNLDNCDVCGGDGTSCLDCHGILYGDSTYDCGICVDKRNSSNSQLKDCVGICGGQNTMNFIKGNEVCLGKDDGQTTFPCDGMGNFSTYLNSCGHCVGGNTGLPLDFGQDLCGVCNGNNECVGCDGVPNSGWTIDYCGKCSPSERNSDCFSLRMVFVNSLDVNQKYENMGILIGGKNMLSTSVVNCDIVPKFNVSSKVKTPKLEVVIASEIAYKSTYRLFSLKWKMEPDCTVGAYSLQCVLQFNNATYTVELLQHKSLYIVNTSIQRIVNNEPAKIRIESQQYIELKLKGFPPLNEGVFCLGYYNGSFMRFLTRIIAEDVIQCDISYVKVPIFNVTVTTSFAWFHDRTYKVIEIVPDQPTVLSAYLTKDLLEIHINFNTNIVFRNSDCSVLFDEPTLQLYGLKDSVCKHFKKRLIIMLSHLVQLSKTMNLTFAENNQICSMYNRRKLGDCLTESITVSLLQTTEPSFSVVGSNLICMGNLTVNIVNVLGAGTTELRYVWKISPSLKNNAPLEAVTEKNLEFSFESEEMKIYIPYVLSVYGVNAIGMKSRTYYHPLQRIRPESGLEKVYVSLSGPRVADPTKENTYFVYLEACNNSLFQHVQFNILWSVNTSDFKLPVFWGSQMTISEFQMKGNAFYEISISVLTNYPGLLSTNASITVKTTTAPLMAFVPSLYEVYYNKTFCLDGSLSTDLGRQQGEMTFLWICTQNDSNGCYVHDKDGRGHIRLEQLLQKTTMSSLCIPGGLLNPGLYSFTLLVSKDVRNDNKTCIVKLHEKQDNNEIVIQRATKPSRTTVLNSFVRTNARRRLFWDITRNKDSFATPELKDYRIINFFGFISMPLHYSSSIYNNFKKIKCFTIKSQNDLSYNDQCVEVLYGTGPWPKVLKVSPKSGLAFVTPFTLDATEGWFTQADNHPLNYRFVYQFQHTLEEITIATVRGHIPRLNNVRMPCGRNMKEMLLVSVYVCNWNKICTGSSTSVTVQCLYNDTNSGITDVANELQKEINKRNFQRSLALASVIMKTFEWRQDLSSLDLLKRQTNLCSKATIIILEFYSRSLFRVPYLVNEAFDVVRDVMNIFLREAMSDRIKTALHRLVLVMIELLKDKRCRRMSPFSDFWQISAGTSLLIRPGVADCYSLSEEEIKILLTAYELLKKEITSYERYNRLTSQRDSSEELFTLMLTSVENDYSSPIDLSTTSGNTVIYATQIYTSTLNNELFNIIIFKNRKYYYVKSGLRSDIYSWLCKNEEICRLYSFNAFICIHSPSSFLKISDLRKASLGQPLSHIVHLKMWTFDNALESELKNKSVTISFPNLTSIEEVDEIQCVTWNKNIWEAVPCLNVKFVQQNFECNCYIKKYIGVFKRSEKRDSTNVEKISHVLKKLSLDSVLFKDIDLQTALKQIEDTEVYYGFIMGRDKHMAIWFAVVTLSSAICLTDLDWLRGIPLLTNNPV
ncbi:uncharacterized protein LOC143227417 [Tachypleus tridentatus]|uniref:uncharacterized protein LOC143227417 n=1 Tax=Tachypleus tridentatus TaxID=6853 RepID=UPI003FCFD62B